jgi:hypothetical protein
LFSGAWTTPWIVSLNQGLRSFDVLRDDDDLGVRHARVLLDVADDVLGQRVGQDLVDHDDVDVRVVEQAAHASDGARVRRNRHVAQPAGVLGQIMALRIVRGVDQVDRADRLLGDRFGQHRDDAVHRRHLDTARSPDQRFCGGILDTLVGAVERPHQRALADRVGRLGGGQGVDGTHRHRGQPLLHAGVERRTQRGQTSGQGRDLQLSRNRLERLHRLVALRDRVWIKLDWARFACASRLAASGLVGSMRSAAAADALASSTE